MTSEALDLGSQICERALFTMGDLFFLHFIYGGVCIISVVCGIQYLWWLVYNIYGGWCR